MPPDLNSVPRSPRVQAPESLHTVLAPAVPPPQTYPSHSRRTSSAMGPPPVPQNSSMPSSPRHSAMSPSDNTGVGIGPGNETNLTRVEERGLRLPGPIRHPRPLTAAELHLELEKEQEGIVNRLTRELTQLRAQTASVASTTSSTSELFADQYPYNTSSSIPPTSARRHRSSSNLSTRSARSIREAANNSTSVSGVAAPREQSVSGSARPSTDIPRPDISRQNSQSAVGQRGPSASVPASPYVSNSHRQSIPSNAGEGYGNSHPRSPSITAAVAAARYEEAAFHRAELDAVKRENEALRQRIRDLEKSLNNRLQEGSDASRPPGASASASASAS